MEHHAANLIGQNLGLFIPIVIVLLGLLVLYYVLLLKAIIQMLKHNVSSVLLVFSFLSLIPFPLILILGIMILIIWHFHKKSLMDAQTPRKS
jgi:hypothetical protein